MTDKDYIQLATVAKSPYDAAMIEAHLRSKGQPVRMVSLLPDEHLEHGLPALEPDLVFCDAFQFEEPIELIRRVVQLLPDTPVVVLTESFGTELLTQVLQQRARGVVSPRHLDLLHQVVMRELSVRQTLRTLEEARREIRILEKRLEVTTERAQDALMYVQDGIIIGGNDSLALALDGNALDELIGNPLMDFIAVKDQAALKRVLSKLVKSSLKDAEFQCHSRSMGGGSHPMQLKLRPAEYEGESCIEILVQINKPAPRPVARPEPAPAPVAMAVTMAAAPAMAGPRHSARTEVLNQLSANPTASAVVFALIDQAAAVEQSAGFAASEPLFQQVMEHCRQVLPAAACWPLGGGEFLLRAASSDRLKLQSQLPPLLKSVEAQLFRSETASATVHLSAALDLLPPKLPVTQLDKRLAELRHTAHTLSAAGGNRYEWVGKAAVSAETATEPVDEWRHKIESALKGEMLKIQQVTIASLEGDSQPHLLLEPCLPDQGKLLTAAQFMPHAQRNGLDGGIERWLLTEALNTLRLASEPLTLLLPVGEATLKGGLALAQGLQSQLTGLPLKHRLVLCLGEMQLLNTLGQAEELFTALKSTQQLVVAISQFEGNSHSLKLLPHVPARYLLLSTAATSSLLGGRGASESLQGSFQWARQHQCKLVAAPIKDAHGMAMLWQAGIHYVVTAA